MLVRLSLRVWAGLVAVLVTGWAAVRAQPSGVSLDLETLATGLALPVGLAHAGDGSGRLFIVQQPGQILVYDGQQVRPTAFLDIGTLVDCCGERGLLGLAFDPGYTTNGLFYVNYTDTSGDTVVARYQVSESDPQVADPGSELILLSVEQPASNHNGGHLAFGPDGYLYVALGDGGGSGDPQENAQDGGTLLGKLLRLDVADPAPIQPCGDAGAPAGEYAIPADNPFVGDDGICDEIWALGLRNPWRFSFDRTTGDLFIGDVGQGSWEEIDFQPASSGGGENYGWDCYEGSADFELEGCGPAENYVFPVLEYPHQEDSTFIGCSVTGGFRYRGCTFPELWGVYLYGDFCSGRLWGATPDGGGGWAETELLDTSLSISSFGEDERGELYLVHRGDPNGSDGSLLRLGPASTSLIFADCFESGDLSPWSRTGGE